MANSQYKRLFTLDTIGVVKKGPMVIRKIILVPNAAGDYCTFKSWNDSDTVHSEANLATGTITNSNDLTITGNFTAAKVTALDIIDILGGNGNTANWGAWLVGARDSDNQISLSPATATNEASKTYTYKIYTPSTCLPIIKASALAADPTGLDFGDEGFRVHNLALTQLSTSATVYLLVK